MNHLCWETIMHHISGGCWHFISSCAVVLPHRVHLERRGRPVAGDMLHRSVSAAPLPAPLSQFVFFFLKRSQTNIAILIKVTKRALNHSWQICMWLISLITATQGVGVGGGETHHSTDFVRKTNLCIFLIGKGILIEGIILEMKRKVQPVIKWSFKSWRWQLTSFWPLASSVLILRVICAEPRLKSSYVLKQQKVSEHLEPLLSTSWTGSVSSWQEV